MHVLMALPAERLPVVSVPEQSPVALVRYDVVNQRRGRYLAPILTLDAERVFA